MPPPCCSSRCASSPSPWSRWTSACDCPSSSSCRWCHDCLLAVASSDPRHRCHCYLLRLPIVIVDLTTLPILVTTPRSLPSSWLSSPFLFSFLLSSLPPLLSHFFLNFSIIFSRPLIGLRGVSDAMVCVVDPPRLKNSFQSSPPPQRQQRRHERRHERRWQIVSSWYKGGSMGIGRRPTDDKIKVLASAKISRVVLSKILKLWAVEKLKNQSSKSIRARDRKFGFLQRFNGSTTVQRLPDFQEIRENLLQRLIQNLP